MKTDKIIQVIDLGCIKHGKQELMFFGSKAELMEIIIRNLQRDGEFHTFVCQHGHTHRLGLQILVTAQAAT
jgi:hypothetical protein